MYNYIAPLGKLGCRLRAAFFMPQNKYIAICYYFGA